MTRRYEELEALRLSGVCECGEPVQADWHEQCRRCARRDELLWKLRVDSFVALVVKCCDCGRRWIPNVSVALASKRCRPCREANAVRLAEKRKPARNARARERLRTDAEFRERKAAKCNEWKRRQSAQQRAARLAETVQPGSMVMRQLLRCLRQVRQAKARELREKVRQWPEWQEYVAELQRERRREYHRRNRHHGRRYEELRKQKPWYREMKRRRRHERRALGRLRPGIVADLMLVQKGRCANPYCKRKLGSEYDLDHIFPVSRGGRNNDGNLQLMCPPCNNRKRSLSMGDFVQAEALL